MQYTLIQLAVLCILICGCSRGEFDASKAGQLRFTHTTVPNGVPIRYEWAVPASEMQAILEHIAERNPQYDGVLVSGSQAATMSYAGEEIRVSWSRVKQAEPVVLLTIRGHHYMLEEPHVDEFYKLLEKHKQRSSQPEN